MSLKKKIDFALLIHVKNARQTAILSMVIVRVLIMRGMAEISDVCLKRKIRDRLLDQGAAILIQSDEKKVDGMPSIRERAESQDFGVGADVFKAKTTPDEAIQIVCQKWFDVRAFGQVFAFKSKGKSDGTGVSLPIRGPVSIQPAFSLKPISITSTQITKSVSGEGDGSKRGSDTMGMKHRVDEATYVTFGAISPQLSEKTGFSEEDAQKLKNILPSLFEGDASSARPEGSMAVSHLIWWEHDSKLGQYSSAKVHQTLRSHLEKELPLDASALNDSLLKALPTRASNHRRILI